MTFDPKTTIAECETLMLDMDGTILDLAFDTYVWKRLVIKRYAEHHNVAHEAAYEKLFTQFMSMQGKLEWYCLDHWSEWLGFDVLELHREVGDRIRYLPGAREFLEHVCASDVKVLLVTNSHHGTLRLKDDRLQFSRYFDALHSSHDYGHAKEHQQFWHALQEQEGFDPATTVFVDDTESVLQSAADYGIGKTIAVTHPDTSEPARESGEFPGVKGVSELI